MIRASLFGVAVGSGEPIYQQLVAQVRRLIAGGQLKAGDKLPSVRALAQSLTINPMTVSKAFGLLEAEALLVRQRGRVMVVAEQHVGARAIADRVGLLRPTWYRRLKRAASSNCRTVWWSTSSRPSSAPGRRRRAAGHGDRAGPVAAE